MEQIRVVELFAGVGGFRLGLEQASSCFQTVWANQWEPSMRSQFAFECYERHFGHRPEHVCQNIVTAKENIPPHDLLVGGFPCQDYSIAKKGARGIEGKKGVLWWEINAILRAHKPRYVLLENVDRLIKSPAWQKGRDFSIILRCFYEAGYAVEWRVINAADYGEAQRRRRTFLFAFRNDTALFRKAAELICVEGLKGAHQLLLQDGFFAPIFPLYGFERKYSEGWLDEFRYLDLKDLSAAQSCHSSATYQLIESGGNIKAVQGNTGHATTGILMDTYAHTQDKPRLELTEKIEADFYTQDVVDAKPQEPPENKTPVATKITGKMILEAIRQMDAEERRELTRVLFA